MTVEMLQRGKLILDIVSSVSVIVGVTYAILSFHQAGQQQRVDASTAIIAQFNESSMIEARTEVFEFHRRVQARYNRVSPRDVRALIGIELSSGALSRELQAVVSLVAFFDSVWVCIEGGRCEEKTLRSGLGQYAAVLYCNFEFHIDLFTAADMVTVTNYGDGLQKFTTGSRSCS